MKVERFSRSNYIQEKKNMNDRATCFFSDRIQICVSQPPTDVRRKSLHSQSKNGSMDWISFCSLIGKKMAHSATIVSSKLSVSRLSINSVVFFFFYFESFLCSSSKEEATKEIWNLHTKQLGNHRLEFCRWWREKKVKVVFFSAKFRVFLPM